MTNLDLHFANRSTVKKTPSEQYFHAWVKCALDDQCGTAEISLSVVDIEEMTEVNFSARGINKPTNTLALTYPQESCDLPLFGDIIMCAPVIEDEAQKLGIEKAAHWAHLTIHSSLHLLGYDHKNDEEAKIMEALETKMMNSLGYDNPYQDLACGDEKI